MNKGSAVALMVILILFPLLSGCSSTSIIDDKSSVKRIGEETQKRVVVWHTYSDEEMLVFEKEVVPKFEAEHPDIHIESVRQTHSQEYHTALLARASAGKTPDIIRMDYSWVPLFAHQELLHPLDQFHDFEQVAGQLQERMLETNKYDGHMYGLPLNITTKAAIYNAKLLEKIGVVRPPATFSELVKLAREHEYILGMSGIELWNSLPYFMALGGRLSNDEFTAVQGYLDSEQSIEAMESLLGLYKEGVINPHMLGGDLDLWREIFAPSRVLMLDEGPWYYSILLNSSSIEADLLLETKPAVFPSDGATSSIIGGESLVMTRDARNKPEAWTFMSWMARKETQLMMFQAGVIPVNTEAFETGRQSEGGVNRYLPPFMEGMEQAFYMPSIPEWKDIGLLYEAAMEDIFIRNSDIRETLKSASAKMDALLARQRE